MPAAYRDQLGVAGLWLVLGVGLAMLTSSIVDWYVMTDELLYERLAISIASLHSPLPHIHGELIGNVNQLYPLLLAPFFHDTLVPSALFHAHVLNAFVMSSLLQEVARSGTAARAQATLKRPDIYGKTGTTNDSLDAWFAGFTRSLVGVVWIGYDQPRKLGDKETGGGLALPVWIDYMGTALKGTPVSEPTPPEGLINVGGEWYYEEYGPGNGIASVGLEDPPAAPPPTEEERKSILDLFKN